MPITITDKDERLRKAVTSDGKRTSLHKSPAIEEPKDDKALKAILDITEALIKTVQDNNILMQNNINMMQTAIKAVMELKESVNKDRVNLDWKKISLTFKRDFNGRISSPVEMERKA